MNKKSRLKRTEHARNLQRQTPRQCQVSECQLVAKLPSPAPSQLSSEKKCDRLINSSCLLEEEEQVCKPTLMIVLHEKQEEKYYQRSHTRVSNRKQPVMGNAGGEGQSHGEGNKLLLEGMNHSSMQHFSSCLFCCPVTKTLVSDNSSNNIYCQ